MIISCTDYAIRRGAYVNQSYKASDGRYAVRWWLRSPGQKQYDAGIVELYGTLEDGSVSYDGAVVRPALWIDLNYLTRN